MFDTVAADTRSADVGGQHLHVGYVRVELKHSKAQVMIIVNSILMGWETEALTTNVSMPGFAKFGHVSFNSVAVAAVRWTFIL